MGVSPALPVYSRSEPGATAERTSMSVLVDCYSFARCRRTRTTRGDPSYPQIVLIASGRASSSRMTVNTGRCLQSSRAARRSPHLRAAMAVAEWVAPGDEGARAGREDSMVAARGAGLWSALLCSMDLSSLP